MPLDIMRFLTRIVPIAADSLAAIRTRAAHISDLRLRREALASADGKAYHVAGASILATFLPRETAQTYVEVVAPLETIYDYLDNLCDRHPEVPHAAYPVLHQAIADALDPNAQPRDYYAAGPAGDDSGYLPGLVRQTQTALAGVPYLDRLIPLFEESATLYAQMQTYKHLPKGEREIACVAWYERHRKRFSALDWHEFACAAGSQFQVYGPLYAALAGEPEDIAAAYDAYFPYVSALHVLLDSYIDQAEDAASGELNFAAVYGSRSAMRARMRDLALAARDRLNGLRNPYRHQFVLDVMMLFYLSHAKIGAQGLDREARAILRSNAR